MSLTWPYVLMRYSVSCYANYFLKHLFFHKSYFINHDRIHVTTREKNIIIIIIIILPSQNVVQDPGGT